MKKKILILAILVMFLFVTSRITSRGVEENNIIETMDQVLAAPLAAPAVKKDTKSLAIENYLKSKGHGDFSNVAKTIQKSCQKYNMPFETILAIAILESGYGTSNIAKEKQNFFGIRAYDWDPELASDFSNLSLAEAIDYQILILKNDYFSQQYDTLEEIAKAYCKEWKHWLNEVSYISQEIKIKIEGGVK